MVGAATSSPEASPATRPSKRAGKRVSINPFEKKKQVWPLILVAALAGGGGVYLAVAPDDAPRTAPSAALVATAAPTPPTAKSVKKRQTATGAFSGSPNFEFVCTDKDFREIATSLHQMVSPAALADPGAGGGAGSSAVAPVPSDTLRADAGVKGSGLDWYELPATAIIRKHCCPAAAPLLLPESAGWCEQLQSAVRRVADDSSKAVDLAPAARAFDKAVNCLFANKIARPYAYEKPPTDPNRNAFQQFLGRAAVSDARR
jgi:hypothetical protein